MTVLPVSRWTYHTLRIEEKIVDLDIDIDLGRFMILMGEGQSRSREVGTEYWAPNLSTNGESGLALSGLDVDIYLFSEAS